MTLQNSVDKSNSTFYLSCGKRMFDLALALVSLILLSPVLIITALLVRVQLGSPVLFKQIRPGLHEKSFAIFKFRTMTDVRDEDGQLFPNALRLTRLGAFLRKSSIDELPELINVLKGDMSLVGPRPLRVEYLPLYTQEQARRHEGKPGITGWAQINGRNAISWEEKFKLDVWYVDNRSFWLDVKIVFLTFWKVFKREGINKTTEITMEPFKGVKLND